jgi:SAM-dependent methyltransferase
MKPPSDYRSSTTAYYDAHASEFCEKTVSVNMSELYVPFLREIPEGGRILDAGCGSGRDSLAFLQKGYQVVSIDASRAMVAATSQLTGQPAFLMCFDDIPFEAEFDGIWACASLPHVARQDLPLTLEKLTRALKPGGILYLSFKYGSEERIEDGRFFTDLEEARFHEILVTQPELEPLQVWITDDVRNDRKDSQRWLNATARRRVSNAVGGSDLDVQ